MYFRIQLLPNGYDVYREECLLYKQINPLQLQELIIDRSIIHDSDIVDYSWGHIGAINGSTARELLRQSGEPTPKYSTGGWVLL